MRQDYTYIEIKVRARSGAIISSRAVSRDLATGTGSIPVSAARSRMTMIGAAEDSVSLKAASPVSGVVRALAALLDSWSDLPAGPSPSRSSKVATVLSRRSKLEDEISILFCFLRILDFSGKQSHTVHLCRDWVAPIPLQALHFAPASNFDQVVHIACMVCLVLRAHSTESSAFCMRRTLERRGLGRGAWPTKLVTQWKQY